MYSTTGLLADRQIKQLIVQNIIQSTLTIQETQIQPASLDLRLGDVAYRIKASFLPGKEATVEQKLKYLNLHRLDISKGAVLETNCVYLVPLQEHLTLPNTISALANPKSSTGRLDIFTRLVSDYAQKFNVVEAGYKGNLYLEISPRTFPIIVKAGSKLSQLRFRNGDTDILDKLQLEQLHKKYKDLGNLQKQSIDLTVNLSGKDKELIGYKAKKHTDVIDVDKIGFYPVVEFWEPIYHDKSKTELILDPQQFYILSSYENVFIPEEVAAEMVAFDPLIGEFRAHYAGFFDPGFGILTEGKSKAVLEVRSFDVPFILEHKQLIGKLLFEPMCEIPEKLYGVDKKSNYQAQQLKLAKHFY